VPSSRSSETDVFSILVIAVLLSTLSRDSEMLLLLVVVLLYP
jgi:hypothetical protein